MPYCLGDLAVAVFQRKAPAVRLEWNGAQTPPKVEPPLSTGLTA
jgi:hypothetical protein